MSSTSLRSRVEALRDILREAARGGFGGIAAAPDLGSRLRVATDRVLAAAGDASEARGLAEWRADLSDFEGLEGDTQAVVVARGMRHVFGLVGGAVRARARGEAPAHREADGEAGARSVLQQPTSALPGIGPALADRLAERGLETVEDLVWQVPRRYDDARHVQSLSEAVAEVESGAGAGEPRAFSGVVASSRFSRNGRRRWVEVRVVDAGAGAPGETGAKAGAVLVRWFNANPGMAARFPRGSRVVLSGKLARRGSAVEMANPDVLEVETPDGAARRAPGRILPRYPDVPGVAPGIMRRTCGAAVDRAQGVISDGVPAAVAARQGLPSLDEALARLHRPPDELCDEDVDQLVRGDSRWHRRLAFGDLFVLGVAVALRRRERRADIAVPCAADVRGALEDALPFRLTGAQRRAIDAIARDLARPVPMNRLLQGDVGAGKTAVALAAAAQVARSGRQVALMAPTEILAEQHMAGLEPWCRALGMRVALVTAATPRAVRASTASLLAAGQIDLVIGTHALLAGDVSFRALGLVIIDEQHRFGVAQRVRLRGKGDGDGAPHLLVMTATPIPRTLALSAYGDLDLALLDEMPPGRQPPRTRVLAGADQGEAMDALARVIREGRRAFWVCPLVAPSTSEEQVREWADATSRAEELARALGPGVVELVHGRMSQEERDRAMLRFRDGPARVLVATTVIEVGIDVPSATLIVVEDADRFGLAQLHQLRGRVGRGGGASECLLLTRRTGNGTAMQRLAVMEATSDGFQIAEEDLAMRGPGELIGVRQAGLPRLRFGDLVQHVELLARAREEAERVVDEDPDLSRPENAALRRVLAERMAEMEVYGAESG
ncbi:MAG TPA: ATP-dependent DNA helicase RecG [Kofleriaceae bacterium]|nr:ATP-dependent DNA helicase RecG [Kofleriaceae bacterium]